MTPTLETDRLWLRPLVLTDAPAVQQYFNNWNIVQFLSTKVPWPYPDDGALCFLRDVLLPTMAKGEAFGWGIVPKDGPNKVVGMIEQRLGEAQTESRGFWLGEPFWGRGYMTEAVIRTQEYVFVERGIERMVLLNSQDNAASRRVKEKTGAVRIGTAVLEHHHADSTCDKWELTQAQWSEWKRVNRGDR